MSRGDTLGETVGHCSQVHFSWALGSSASRQIWRMKDHQENDEILGMLFWGIYVCGVGRGRDCKERSRVEKGEREMRSGEHVGTHHTCMMRRNR